MLTILTFLALWFAASVVTVGAYSLMRWLHSSYEASMAPIDEALR